MAPDEKTSRRTPLAPASSMVGRTRNRFGLGELWSCLTAREIPNLRPTVLLAGLIVVAIALPVVFGVYQQVVGQTSDHKPRSGAQNAKEKGLQAWNYLRAWNVGPLLVGLPQELNAASSSSRRVGATWARPGWAAVSAPGQRTDDRPVRRSGTMQSESFVSSCRQSGTALVQSKAPAPPMLG